MKNFWSIVAAYLVAWAIFFGYSLSVSYRLAHVEENLKRLKQMLQQK